MNQSDLLATPGRATTPPTGAVTNIGITNGEGAIVAGKDNKGAHTPAEAWQQDTLEWQLEGQILHA